MDRLLIIPAAGMGSRLGAHTPKLLALVNGRPMLDHLLTLYAPVVEQVALVVHPSARAAVLHALQDPPHPVDVFVQEEPTGMLDAILLARPAVEGSRPRRVWITWCDQVAIHPRTVLRLAGADAGDPLIGFPTCTSAAPYVHFPRDASGRITGVLHRREGDAMPETGESDAGLFSLSRHAYLDLLAEFAAAPGTGSATGERNFLPFIPWAAARGAVVTFPCTEAAEAVGVNTPEDLAVAERTLQQRAREAV
jgi:bifunctional N-acetylglucosamine-1-phosphate-uridyltransferase/glucosamine-1-phosphate-acetyltransferase GlmU-like protein